MSGEECLGVVSGEECLRALTGKRYLSMSCVCDVTEDLKFDNRIILYDNLPVESRVRRPRSPHPPAESSVWLHVFSGEVCKGSLPPMWATAV